MSDTNNKPIHPWNLQYINKLKLQEARKEAKRRYERGEMHKTWRRDNYRLKRGFDIDSPMMTPQEAMAKARQVKLSRIAAQKEQTEL